jgi:hypothetical protein
MEKEDVENYLKQLENFEKAIGSDNEDEEIDLNFVNELCINPFEVKVSIKFKLNCILICSKKFEK